MTNVAKNHWFIVTFLDCNTGMYSTFEIKASNLEDAKGKAVRQLKHAQAGELIIVNVEAK